MRERLKENWKEKRALRKPAGKKEEKEKKARDKEDSLIIKRLEKIEYRFVVKEMKAQKKQAHLEQLKAEKQEREARLKEDVVNAATEKEK